MKSEMKEEDIDKAICLQEILSKTIYDYDVTYEIAVNVVSRMLICTLQKLKLSKIKFIEEMESAWDHYASQNQGDKT